MRNSKVCRKISVAIGYQQGRGCQFQSTRCIACRSKLDIYNLHIKLRHALNAMMQSTVDHGASPSSV